MQHSMDQILTPSIQPPARHTDPVALAGGTGGVIIALTGLLLLPGFSKMQPDAPISDNGNAPFKYVEARLLKQGEIKDEEALPDRIVPALPTAPEEVLPLDTKEQKPEPVKKQPKESEPQADAVTDEKLRQVFDNARAFAEIQDDYVPEGHPDGVPDGDVTDPALASLGDTYGRRITRYIQERLVYPTIIPDEVLKKLSVKIIIKFNVDMRIISYEVKKKSGNALFDDAVTNAIERTQKEAKDLPPPPEAIAPRIYGGGLMTTLHGADAPMQ